uniref:Uncharacterized protein n=1 Tax=Tetradesmus obliquus TaxID=3088 RepID=A0A383VB38_TETOB|eukprot:jgi/Sobl393_1/3294/SZX61824.1
MAPKKKGGSKKKEPAYETSSDVLGQFGLKLHEIVRTPLGLQVTVIGVKYENPTTKAGGQVWVRYSTGHEAPLEGGSNAAALGFRRCTEADHIRRDVLAQEVELQKLEEKRRVVEEVLKLKQQGLPIPEHLLPPPKADKPKKKEDGKGAKKK